MFSVSLPPGSPGTRGSDTAGVPGSPEKVELGKKV
jgi:hypothetical protein